MPTRRFTLIIQATDDRRKVPVRTIVEKLGKLQSAIVHLGDYLTGSDFRGRGRSPDFVRKRCSLVLAEVQIGSLETVLELQDPQTTVEGEPTLGEEAIRKLMDIASLIESGEDVETRLSQTIEDPLHRTRIIDDCRGIWPEEEERVGVLVSVPDGQPSRLTPHGRLVLEGLLARLRVGEEASVKGVLGTIHLVPGRKVVKVLGPDGHITCTISKDVEKAALKLAGKPAIVYGEAEFDAASNVKEIVSVTKIEPFTEFNLHRVFKGENELVLKQPVTVRVDYQDDMWTMENEDLGIVSVAADYDECLKDFQDELFLIWEEYGKERDEQLTDDARQLKQRLLAMVHGASE